MNAKFNVMRDLLVIRCVTSVRDEFAWHEVAQIRKLPEFFEGSPSSNRVFEDIYDTRVLRFEGHILLSLYCFRFSHSVSAIQFQRFIPTHVQNQNTSYVVAFVRVAQET